MLIHISYPLEKLSPLYPGSPEVSFNPVRSIANNDSANTSLFSFGNHSGTHIDVPLHFCDKGFSVVEMLMAENVFSPAICINIVKEPNSYIYKTDLESFAEQIHDVEVLLIRTGFFRYRQDQSDVYTTSHPWIHPDVPEYLRETCPLLKVIGIDTISISNPSHREEGRASHRAFLCGEFPLLLLEDANLSDSRLVGNIFELHIYPWVINEVDATPVTVLAALNKDII